MEIRDMQPIARDGELVLYATEDRTEGILYDTVCDIQSPRQPLQVFFKWCNFEAIEAQDGKTQAAR